MVVYRNEAAAPFPHRPANMPVETMACIYAVKFAQMANMAVDKMACFYEVKFA